MPRNISVVSKERRVVYNTISGTISRVEPSSAWIALIQLTLPEHLLLFQSESDYNTWKLIQDKTNDA